MKCFHHLALGTLLVLASPCVASLEAAAEAPAPKKVAILLFDEVEIIDYTGPYEVFGANDAFEVYTVAASPAAVTTAMGMKVIPKYSFADAPAADVVVIPGGGVDRVQSDPATLDWIKTQAAHAEHVLSVCNGAFTLANTGLLAGLKSTTTSGNIDTLRRRHPEITVLRDQRVVDNGKIVTAGGLSAGIDGALHVMSTMLGEGEARDVAQMLEYDWHPEGGYLPATFASHVLPRADTKLAAIIHSQTVLSTTGDADHWTKVWRVSSDLNSADLLKQAGAIFADAGHWTAVEAAASATNWHFVDSDDKPWDATLSVGNTPGQAGKYLVTIALARAN